MFYFWVIIACVLHVSLPQSTWELSFEGFLNFLRLNAILREIYLYYFVVKTQIIGYEKIREIRMNNA